MFAYDCDHVYPYLNDILINGDIIESKDCSIIPNTINTFNETTITLSMP